jgi:hypothetical protein
VVDLPLGATEDRVVGALDLERALSHGEKAFEPGLLAKAHRGFLYIDEANLLEDHLVDLLLDVAASGENLVEREGLSVRHQARFVLVGSGNPEEGELRPQLLDRFGLSVEVTTPKDLATRIDVVRRRDAFERDPEAFTAEWAKAEAKLRRRLGKAKERLWRDRGARPHPRDRGQALHGARHRRAQGRAHFGPRRPGLGRPRRRRKSSTTATSSAWPPRPFAIACAATRSTRRAPPSASSAPSRSCSGRERGRGAARARARAAGCSRRH